MAGATSRGCWQGFERDVAGNYPPNKRNMGSGAINSNDDGTARPGDVLTGFRDLMVECKLKAAHAHHTLFNKAREDAKKHGINPKHVFLYTRVKRERGYRVVLDAEFFHEVCLPHVLDYLAKKEIPIESSSIPAERTSASIESSIAFTG